jgi:hypothetical protein
MPSCVPPKQKQLTTQQANESRFVTKCRWPVEVVNGLLKTLFRANDKVTKNISLPDVLDDYRISAALINRFHRRLLSDKDNATHIAEQMKSKVMSGNKLETIFESLKIDKKRSLYQKLDSSSICDFPKLDYDTIKNNITLGTYQLRQSLSYLAEHLNESGDYIIEVFDDKTNVLDSNVKLLRTRIQSRHSNATKYNSYITYKPNTNNFNGIDSWLCTCKNGKRTVGCCSHIASVVYFLSYGRYRNLSLPSQSIANIFDSEVTIEGSEDEDQTTPMPIIESSEDEEDVRTSMLNARQEQQRQYTSIYPDLSNEAGPSGLCVPPTIYPNLSNLME